MFKRIILIIIFLNYASFIYGYEYNLYPHLCMSEMYDDNLYLTHTNKKEDFVSVITPGFNSGINWKFVKISALYDFSYSDYLINTANNSLRHHGVLGCDYDIDKLTHFRLSESYDKTEDTYSISGSGTNSYPITAETGQISGSSNIVSSTNVNLDHQFGEKNIISSSYIHILQNYANNTIPDNRSDTINVNMTYYPDPLLGYEFQGSYLNGYYDPPKNPLTPLTNQDFQKWMATLQLKKDISRTFQIKTSCAFTSMVYSDSEINNNYQVYNPSIGIKDDFGNDEILDINVGYFIQSIERKKNESGMTINGNIGKTWRYKEGSFNISGSSGYDDSQLNQDNLGFNIYYQLDMTASYAFSQSFTSSWSTSFRHSDYINSLPDTSDRIDKFITSSLSLRWHILKWLESSVEYRNSTLKSNTATDYEDNRVTVAVSLISYNSVLAGSH